jgi:spore coat polysaccharide biosynthesis predicted glycosyltransferase SpsG
LEATLEKVDDLGIDLLVVDRQAADEGFLDALAGKVKTLAVFGDTVHLRSYAAHALIDPTMCAHLPDYSCEGVLLLGTEFALLSTEFDPFQDFHRVNPLQARRILVYSGATDHSIEAVQLLKSVHAPFSATLLASDNPKLGEELAREIGIDPRFMVLRDDGNIAKRLASCDLAITGPETLCEPALFSLPVALIGESPLSDYVAKNGLALSLGAADCMDVQSATSLEALLSDKVARDRMSARLGELVDGLGRFRLADELLKIYMSERGGTAEAGSRERKVEGRMDCTDELQVFGNQDYESETQLI